MHGDRDLPRSPEYFLARLAILHDRVRARLYREGASTSTDALAAVAQARGGDTIFAIDMHAEEELESFFSAWSEELPLLLMAEGFPADGGKTYPAGASRADVAFTCMVDPIDGTRGLMYQKRSAWILSGIAPPPRDALPTLAEIHVAMQTELPTSRSHLSDRLWATAGGGTYAETTNLETGEVRPFRPQPSRANSLLYGFGTVSKFFPGAKVPAVQVEERLFRELFGPPPDGNPQVFDDEYISTGGQLYELMVGHDRFTADLRPLFLAALSAGGQVQRICSHPYDLCTELIAREAGVAVTDERGEPLRYSLDIRTDCNWIGYANASIKAQIEPRLMAILREEFVSGE
jgi:hypothetical protein